MIENIAAGLAATILAALLIYTFKIKQLYLVVPRLFSNSWLTDKGKLVEIRIFNRGRSTEENIEVALDPSISYEVVAATDSTSTLINSNVLIPRVPPGDDYSVLLLVEGGDFMNERISGVSSSTTKGKIIKGLEDVPPNAGKVFLVLIAFVLLLVIPIAGIEGYQAIEESREHEYFVEVTNALNNEWNELEGYAKSDFGKNYSLGEFPIQLVEKHRVGNRVVLKFRLINKAAAPLKINLNVESPFYNKDPEPWNSSRYELKTVPSASAEEMEFILFSPQGEIHDAKFQFQISVGSENHIKAIKHLSIDE